MCKYIQSSSTKVASTTSAVKTTTACVEQCTTTSINCTSIRVHIYATRSLRPTRKVIQFRADAGCFEQCTQIIYKSIVHQSKRNTSRSSGITCEIQLTLSSTVLFILSYIYLFSFQIDISSIQFDVTQKLKKLKTEKTNGPNPIAEAAIQAAKASSALQNFQINEKRKKDKKVWPVCEYILHVLNVIKLL